VPAVGHDEAVSDRLGAPVVTFFIVVAVVAGITAIALLGWPGSTGSYFSWRLNPVPAASLLGGLYLTASAIFAWALTLRFEEVRGLCVAVFGLAVPTLVVSIIHDEVFDSGRWQAVAWMVLFVVAPLSVAAILVSRRDDLGRDAGARLVPWTRAVLAVLAMAFGVLAVLIWIDATSVDLSEAIPVGLRALTGKYVGAWCSFLALLLGWGAVRDRWSDARVAVVTVGMAALSTLLAAARSFDELTGGRGGWVLSAAAVAVVAGLVLWANQTRPASPAGT
jgi:predicted secreted protein